MNDIGILYAWLAVTVVGIAAAFGLGWIVGRGQKLNAAQEKAIAAAASTCPSCHAPLRDSHGKFIKPGHHLSSLESQGKPAVFH